MRGERHEELLFNGYRVSGWDSDKVLDMDGGMISQQCECNCILYLAWLK